MSGGAIYIWDGAIYICGAAGPGPLVGPWGWVRLRSCPEVSGEYRRFGLVAGGVQTAKRLSRKGYRADAGGVLAFCGGCPEVWDGT